MGEAENMNDALTNMHIRNKNEAPGAAGGNPAGNDGKAINIATRKTMKAWIPATRRMQFHRAATTPYSDEGDSQR